MSPLPSNTTRFPISAMPRCSKPLPSPSPDGSPESSKSALKDSRCGVTNSLRIGTTEASFGGCLKFFSRSSVSNVLLTRFAARVELSGMTSSEERSASASFSGTSRYRALLKNLARVSRSASRAGSLGLWPSLSPPCSARKRVGDKEARLNKQLSLQRPRRRDTTPL